MAMLEIELSIIIASWNTADLLKQCLNSLIPLFQKMSLEVIVVDNNSSDGSVVMCEKYFPYVHLIKNSRNFGYGQANNQGILASRSDFILLLNSDTIVEPGNIEKLLNVMKKNSSVGVVGCRPISPDGSYQTCCANFSNLSRVIVERLLLNKISQKLPTMALEPPFLFYMKHLFFLRKAQCFLIFSKTSLLSYSVSYQPL